MIHIIKSVIQDIHTIVDLRNRKVLIEALFYRYSLVKEIKHSPARRQLASRGVRFIQIAAELRPVARPGG